MRGRAVSVPGGLNDVGFVSVLCAPVCCGYMWTNFSNSLLLPLSSPLQKRWVNTVLLKELFSGGGGISRTTAHSWIYRLGFRWKKSGKCVYVDGHNRPDVVEARREYVAKMLILRKMMSM